MKRSVFDELAFLYTPADPAVRAQVLEADERWRFPGRPPDGVEVIVWGRPPQHDGPTRAAVQSAVLRELAVARLRAGRLGGFRSSRINRLPPAPRAGWIRRAVRAAIGSGLVVELAREEPPPRVIDEVLAAATGIPQDVRLRPSGDGSALVRLQLEDGGAGELRVARLGRLRDTRRAEAALRRLGAAEVPRTPRLVGSGETCGAAWTVETALPGRLPGAMTPPLLAEVTRLLALLPRSPEPPRSLRENLRTVGEAFPAHAPALEAAAPVVEAWAARLPAILVHGDLWLGNLLVNGGGLSGVIDWDASYPAGLPGADLLNLLYMGEGRRRRRTMGEAWAAAFWNAPDARAALAPYWTGLGVTPPDPMESTAIAVDWWAGQVVAALRRARQPASNPDWVRGNVDAVVAGILGTLGIGPASPAEPALAAGPDAAT